MSREEFIGKLQMVYIGDRNAFNDIVCAYNSVLSANEKAIEYINNFWKEKSYYGSIENCLKFATMNEFEKEDLLNILQNGSEENE